MNTKGEYVFALGEVPEINVPEIKLKYVSSAKKSFSVKITKSYEASALFQKIIGKDEIEVREEVVVLFLNQANKVLGYYRHTTGGITSSLVDIRLILATALNSLSTSIILCHNHPSGNLKPSDSDYSITNKLKFAAKQMDIALLDHIIITKESYYSLADEGDLSLNGIAEKTKDIIYLDLFSGTGGFAKGFQNAGFHFKKHYYSEIDKYSVANYQYNFNSAINLGDVTKINTKKIERPNIICFGSPCQDISIAGKRKGLKGKRSNLFFEAVRIIRECKPDVFIFENVKGLFSSDQGKDFEIILQTFADLGLYDIQWQLLNTCWFLPQNRERIYFVGCLRNKTQHQIFPIGESNQGSDAFDKKESEKKNLSPTIDTKVGDGSHRSPYVLHWKGSNVKWNYGKMKTSPALNTQQDWIRQPLIANGAAYRTRNYKGEGGKIEIRKDKNANQLTTVQKDSMVMLRELTKNESETNRVYDSKNGLSKTIKASGHGSGSQTGNYLVGENIRRLTPNECERLQGFPDGWTKSGVFDVPEATQKGYATAQKGDSINLSYLEANKRRGRVGKGMANTIDTGANQYTLDKNTLRKLTPIECERLQGFKDNWTRPGVFDGKVNEISDSQRYKMLGNAVSVPVVEAIAERLLGKQIFKSETTKDETIKLLTLELELELFNIKHAA
jgi:DNA (cytosine-5)-methyltransferase 1